MSNWYVETSSWIANFAQTCSLSNMSSYHKSAFIELPNPDLDCPNRGCSGWLSVYGTPDEPTPKPVFFQCSNKQNPNERFRCFHPTIFSKKEGNCSACSKVINTGDIITRSWEGAWVHLPCAYTLIKPKNIFAKCLRCGGDISKSSDADRATKGLIDGFVHLGCVKKRPRQADETDEEVGSSQESRA